MRYILLILLLLATPSYASLDKTSQGYFYGHIAGNPVTDQMVVESGTWGAVCSSYTHSLCLSNTVSGEVRINEALYTVPDDFVIAFDYHAGTLDATDDTTTIKFRWTSDTDYYAVVIHWTSSSPTIELKEFDSGGCSAGCDLDTDHTWTPALTSERYEFQIVVAGASMDVYLNEVAVISGGGDTDSVKAYANQDDFIVLGSAVLSGSDATWTEGQVKIATDVTGTTISIGNLKMFTDSDIVVNGLETGQYALFCQQPENHQWLGGTAVSTNAVKLFSDASPYRLGQEFHFNEGVDLFEVNVFARAVGSPTGNIVMKIYDDSSGPSSVVATSDEVAVSSLSTTTSPYNIPEEVTFTFSSPYTLTTDTTYYAIIEDGTSFAAASPNDYVEVKAITSSSYSIGTYRYYDGGSWQETTTTDLVYVARAEEVMRASAAESSGTATLAMAALWLPLDGKIKIATSATDCQTDLVDSTPRMTTHTGGDIWTYTSGKLLTAGPVLGCPLDGDFKIWMRGSDYDGGTQVGKIQYSTEALPGTAAGCTGACTNTSTVNLTSTTDYAGAVDLNSLTANTYYNYHVVIDDTIQEDSASFFTTPPSNSTDVDYAMGTASCFGIKNKPWDHLDNMAVKSGKIFWSLGDNIYTDFPRYFYPATTQEGYWQRHRDSVMEKTLADMSKFTYQCKIFDDHEFKNNFIGTTGTSGETEAGARDVSFADVNARNAVDDYLTPFMPDPIRVSTNYYQARWGKHAFVTFDLITDKDSPFDNNIGYYVGHNFASLTNAGWEAGDTSGWTCYDSAGGACSNDDVTSTGSLVHSGTYAGAWNDTSLEAAQEQAITVTASTEYLVEAYMFHGEDTESTELEVRTSSASGGFSAGTSVCTDTHSSDYGTYEKLSCVIPDSNSDTSLFIWLKGDTSAFYTLGDDVILLKRDNSAISCSKNGTYADRIDCSAETFTSEDPAVSTTRGVVIYEDRMYGVTVVNSDTQLTLHENITCSTCGAQTTVIWKEGKQMLGREQLLDVADTLKTLDDDANVDVITLISSKALNYGLTTSVHDGWPGYSYQRDLLFGYIKDNITTQPFALTGDLHATMIAKQTWLDSGGFWEFMPAHGAAPNAGSVGSLPTRDSDTMWVGSRHAIGMVYVDTSLASDADSKAAVDFEVRDFNSNIVYTEVDNNVEPITLLLNNNDVVSNQNTHRVARHSDGRIFAMYWNGTEFKLSISDTNGANFADDALDLSELSWDIADESPAMHLFEGVADKLYFAYIKDSVNTFDLWLRTATLTAGVPAWNADETNWDGATGWSMTSNQTVVADDSIVWAGGILYRVATDQYYFRMWQASCGTECVTTVANKKSTGATATEVTDGLRMELIDAGDIMVSYVLDVDGTPDLTASECNSTWCSGAQSLGEIYVTPENPLSSSTGGWQPVMAHDGAGGVGIVYKSATWPYSMMFRKYDGASWGSAVEIGNTLEETQTSPAISRVGNSFYIAFLSGGLTDVTLVRTDDLDPTTAGEFSIISTGETDGFAKSKLMMSTSNDGQSVLIFWQRVFGINQSGHGQFVGFRRLINSGGSPLPIFIQNF